MTQSTASKSLKEVDSILGWELFNRFGRKVEINEQGEDSLNNAKQ